MHVDPVILFLVIICSSLWCWAGFSICKITHRQRGLEVDDWDNIKIPDDLSQFRIKPHIKV